MVFAFEKWKSKRVIFQVKIIYFFSKEEKKLMISRMRQIALSVAAFTFIIRPTSALLWILLAFLYLIQNIQNLKKVFAFILEVILIG